MVRKNCRKIHTVINNYELTTQQKNILDLQKYHEGTAISNICCAIIYDETKGFEKAGKLYPSGDRQPDRLKTEVFKYGSCQPVSFC